MLQTGLRDSVMMDAVSMTVTTMRVQRIAWALQDEAGLDGPGLVRVVGHGPRMDERAEGVKGRLASGSLSAGARGWSLAGSGAELSGR